MYLAIRCPNCARFLYAEERQKTRSCPCGKKIKVRRMRVYARANDERKAGEIVRFLQEKEFGTPHFRSYN
ncbi:MAG: DUF1922 domain-containing protein [Methanosarcinales archaeon]|nr:MAG: DUF1922 domain-containing protein [Methanosarcinales archaeon]